MAKYSTDGPPHPDDESNDSKNDSGSANEDPVEITLDNNESEPDEPSEPHESLSTDVFDDVDISGSETAEQTDKTDAPDQEETDTFDFSNVSILGQTDVEENEPSEADTSSQGADQTSASDVPADSDHASIEETDKDDAFDGVFSDGDASETWGSTTDETAFADDVSFEEVEKDNQPTEDSHSIDASDTNLDSLGGNGAEEDDDPFQFDDVEIDGAYDPDESVDFGQAVEQDGTESEDSRNVPARTKTEETSPAVHDDSNSRRTSTPPGSNTDSRDPSVTDERSSTETDSSASVDTVSAPSVNSRSRIRTPGEVFFSNVKTLYSGLAWMVNTVIAVTAFLIYCAGVALQWGAAGLLVAYGLAMTLVLIDPSASVAGTLANGSGRLAVAFELTIQIIPFIVGVLVLSTLIDVVLNDGESFKDDIGFERL